MANTNEKIAESYETKGYDLWVSKFKINPRESEKALLEAIAGYIGERSNFKLSDLGCGVGTLLAHLRRLYPGATLIGADLASSFVESSKRDPLLAGVQFIAADISNPSLLRQIGDDNDVITMHGVVQLMEKPVLQRCLNIVASVMKSGGLFVDYDCFQNYHPDLHIRLGDHNIYYHNQDLVRSLLSQAGFRDIGFQEFKIQIDLDPGEAREATRTVKLENGERLMFRGAICQCWHILSARKV